MSAPDQFNHNGHSVEIVPPEEEHLKGNFLQIKIDGILHQNVLYSSLPVAVEAAKNLIDEKRGD